MMDDDRRLDLSALDPARDELRWRGVVAATRARVDAVVLHRRQDPLALIAGWQRPLLAAAAAAVVLLVPVEVALERRETRVETVRGLVSASTAWAGAGRTPSGAELLQALRTGETP
jgi:hypothetical protein